MQCDLGDLRSVRDFARRFEAKHNGELDVLVNNGDIVFYCFYCYCCCRCWCCCCYCDSVLLLLSRCVAVVALCCWCRVMVLVLCLLLLHFVAFCCCCRFMLLLLLRSIGFAFDLLFLVTVDILRLLRSCNSVLFRRGVNVIAVREEDRAFDVLIPNPGIKGNRCTFH